MESVDGNPQLDLPSGFSPYGDKNLHSQHHQGCPAGMTFVAFPISLVICSVLSDVGFGMYGVLAGASAVTI